MMTTQEIDRMDEAQVRAALTDDFLERDGNTFVRIRRSGRLGWEDTLKKGSAYSAKMLDPKNEEELLTSAYRHADQIVRAMNTPFKVKIIVSGKDSYTDFKCVNVASSCLQEKDMSLGERLDVFTGYAVHEAAHLLYTNANVRRDGDKVVLFLSNVIEDERIEIRTGEEKPGFANFLCAAKYHAFARCQEGLEKKERKELPIVKTMNALLAMVRYPARLTEEDIRRDGRILLKARQVLTPYPQNTQEAYDAAVKIYELLIEKYEQEGQRQTLEKETGEDSVMRNLGMNGAREMLDADFCTVAEDFEKLIRDSQTPLADEDVANGFKEKHSVLARICQEGMERGNTSDIVTSKPEQDKERYLKVMASVKKHIPSVNRALRSNGIGYDMILRGMRNGTLDAHKIAEAYQGVQSVYRMTAKVKADSMTVALLIDESGSMNVKNKINEAQKVAVLFNEALKNVPNVRTFIYGYYENNDTRLTRYVEPGTGKGFGLGSMKPHGSTPTAKAIAETVNRMTMQGYEKAILFVMSDGMPDNGTESVAKETAKARRKGIDVIGISIDDNLPESELKQMYGRYIKYNNINGLASSLAKVLKKETLSKTTRKVQI